ncbi:hypothetical protein AGLY_012197 [Aphis glycines]|uniref:DDE Tnp4 domain-containing protein n=1 Tax=Aphis glycines TaxID=307491 RepID=A0A6G0TAB0_APHGL|nr:hypothetical protein AGLY_012197 [Aphis glycines]
MVILKTINTRKSCGCFHIVRSIICKKIIDQQDLTQCLIESLVELKSRSSFIDLNTKVDALDKPEIINTSVKCQHIFKNYIYVSNDIQNNFIQIVRTATINVQLVFSRFKICDSKLNILNIHVLFLGSTHDNHKWKNSNDLLVVQELHECNLNDNYLLGGFRYPLRQWLLTPILNPVSAAKIHYNKE